MDRASETAAVQKKLLGALIGLGRAAEGNPTRPTDQTHRILLKGIQMTIPATEPDVGQAKGQIELLHEEKYRMAALCLTCEKQCGRNNDFDMDTFGQFPSTLRWMKSALLALTQSVGLYCAGRSDVPDLYEKATAFLYDALFMIGSTRPEDEHRACLEQGGEILREWMDAYFAETGS